MTEELSRPLEPLVPSDDTPGTPGKPGTDAWEPGGDQPGGVPARKDIPLGAPGTADDTHQPPV